ncbi:MAG: hypothetical protein ACI96W_002412 [Paraglaciecola sp.]|jgi:hypothetical protein
MMSRFLNEQVTDTTTLSQQLAVIKKPEKQLAQEGIGPANIDSEYNFVYTVGTINVRFPTLSLEKEFNQASILSGNTVPSLDKVNDDVGLILLNHNNDLLELLFNGLSDPKNRYIARKMIWTLDNVDNNEVFTLLPTSNERLTQFIAALNPKCGQVIVMGTLLDGDRVAVSNIVPTSLTALTQIIAQEKSHGAPFVDLVDEIISMNANDGNRNAERALNYVLYNNPDIYLESYKLCYKSSQSGPNPSGYQLVNVSVLTSVSGNRLVAKVVFDYKGINTGASQSWYCAVDVTGEYPFLLVKWTRFLSHS